MRRFFRLLSDKCFGKFRRGCEVFAVRTALVNPLELALAVEFAIIHRDPPLGGFGLDNQLFFSVELSIAAEPKFTMRPTLSAGSNWMNLRTSGSILKA